MKDQVPTPFKKALFWPDEIKSNNKRKKDKIPSAITSEKWQEYHKKKQIEKNKKVEEKIKKAGERKKEEKALELQQQAKKKKVLVSGNSSDSEEWVESGDSLDDQFIFRTRRTR